MSRTRWSIRLLYSLWLTYTFTHDELNICREDIVSHNIKSTALISATGAVLIALFSLFPLLAEQDVYKFITYVIVSLFIAVLSLSAHYLRKKSAADKRVQALSLVFFILIIAGMIFFGILIGVVENRDRPASTFMVLLVCIQIVFILHPLQNLLLNLIAVGAFVTLSVLMKPMSLWMFDGANALCAGLAGVIISWYTSYIEIKGMLTEKNLEAERNRFKEESVKDALTGLHNRRDFNEQVDFYRSVCRQVHQTVYVILMDVDYFKNYNDFYGHPMGDEVIRAVGKTLLRLQDEEGVYTARIGGEEFIVMGTENRISEVERVALKILWMIAELNIPHEKSLTAPCVTMSLGLYIMRGGSEDTVECMYSCADKALYKAKEWGRNRIVAIDSLSIKGEQAISDIAAVMREVQASSSAAHSKGRRKDDS